MKFLSRMNGWQRLWFVLTAGALLVFGLIYPYTQAYKYSYSQYGYREDLKKDLSSPFRINYITRPFSRLVEPPYSPDGRNCWHLYTTRKYEDIDTYPYSISAYDNKESKRKREDYLTGALMYGVLVLIASGLLYLVGFLIAWIRRGFVQTA